jgi:hypothetical protein
MPIALPIAASLPDEMRQAWHEDLDAERALRLSSTAERRFERDFDPRRDREALWLASEIRFDNRRLVEASDLAAFYRVAATAVARTLPTTQAVCMKADALIQSAEVAHRRNRPRPSFAVVKAARRLLAEHAGDHAALCRLAASPEENPIGEAYVALLAIAVTALRLAAVSSLPAARLHEDMVQDAMLLLAGPLPAYERMHALVSQTLYAVAARANPADQPFLQRLVGLDASHRPVHPRGRATRHLIDLAVARHAGDSRRVAFHTEAAANDLANAALVRHIDALTHRGWWNRPAWLI